MVNPQGTSFIPQRPTRGKAAPRRVRKIYILAYISYVLFFGSLIAAAGVFFYGFSLDVKLKNQQEILASERTQFNQGDIESVRDLEKRIGIAEERLNNHVSVLSIFEALEKSAVQSLRYTAFSYKRLNDEFPTVAFTGTTDRFNSVMFQREVLSTNPILAGSTFKEVALESTPNEADPLNIQDVVSFTLEKEVDTSLIGYTPRFNASSEEITPEEISGTGEFETSSELGSTENSSENQ